MAIGPGRRQTGHAAPHATPCTAHTPHAGDGQRAHTVYIVVIEAVFQDPMFALNAAAEQNACEPSHTLSKSLRTLEYAKYTPEMSDARMNERSTACCAVTHG
jgi:hypothetical protein